MSKRTFFELDLKSPEALLFEDPDYVAFLMESLPSRLKPWHRTALSKVLPLVERFDAQPMKCECQGEGCHKTATRASAYQRTPRLVYWCDTCDPSQHGASPFKLRIVRTYFDAVIHARQSCDGRVEDMRYLVRELAVAKGGIRTLRSRAGRSDVFRGNWQEDEDLY
jgi:hypothetical protein